MMKKGGTTKPLAAEEAGARGRGRSTRAADEAGAPGRGGRAGATKTQVYCICRKSHENGFMIACDECDEWFHGKCVNISAAQGRRMEKYVCPFCSERRRKRAGGAPRQPQRSLIINDDDQDYEDDGEGDDEPLFSDDDNDEWNQDEAYVKAPWYDPEMDEVNYDEWEAAKRSEGGDGGGDEAGGTEGQQHADESEVMMMFEDEAATSEDHEYQPRTRRSSNGSVGRDGNGVKRKRIYDDAEDEEEEEEERHEEEDTPSSEAGGLHYRGCDETTRAVRERVVTSLAEALSMPRHHHLATAGSEKTSTVEAATALTLAESIEMEMWIMFEKQTSSAYKAKFRTLLFNLKDERNQGLRDSVLSGEMGPVELCKKTSKELAPVELAEWRKQRAEKYFNENVMITEEPGPIVKKTHKGEEVLNGPASPTAHTEFASTTASSPSLSSPALASFSSSSSSSSFSSSSSSSSSSATGDSLQARKRVRLSPPQPTREENGKEHSQTVEEGAGEKEEEEESGMKYDDDDDDDDEPIIDINVDVSANLDEDDIFARPPMLGGGGGSETSLSSSTTTTALTRTPKPRVHENSATFPSPSLSSSSSSSTAAAAATLSPPAASASSSSLFATSPSRPALRAESPGNLVWRGSLAKANVEKCDVVAYHLAGQHDTSLQQLLPEELQVQGRVDLSKLAKYIKGLSTSRHRTHSLLVLEPADDASSVAYIAMLHYFGTKSRAGVVVNLAPGAIKEMYVVPLTSDDEHFRGLLRLDEDKLLVVLVTDKDFKP